MNEQNFDDVDLGAPKDQQTGADVGALFLPRQGMMIGHLLDNSPVF